MNKLFIPLLATLFSISSLAASESIDTLGCILEPSQKLEITSPIASVIDSVPLKRGMRVANGQLLFQLRSGVQRANVELAEAKAAFAKRNVERNEDLFDDDLLSSHEKDEIETEMLIAGLELNVKKEELAMRSVHSPVDGVVVELHNHVGEYVNSDPVLEIAVLDPLYVDVLMPMRNFNTFQQGQSLTVTLPSPLNTKHEAILSIIDPIIDPASGTFRMRLTLENDRYTIPAGVACRIEKMMAN